MFENLKPRVEELERENSGLKDQLAKLRRDLSRLAGENHGLEN
jgi:hypothetical protein